MCYRAAFYCPGGRPRPHHPAACDCRPDRKSLPEGPFPLFLPHLSTTARTTGRDDHIIRRFPPALLWTGTTVPLEPFNRGAQPRPHLFSSPISLSHTCLHWDVDPSSQHGLGREPQAFAPHCGPQRHAAWLHGSRDAERQEDGTGCSCATAVPTSDFLLGLPARHCSPPARPPWHALPCRTFRAGLPPAISHTLPGRQAGWAGSDRRPLQTGSGRGGEDGNWIWTASRICHQDNRSPGRFTTLPPVPFIRPTRCRDGANTLRFARGVPDAQTRPA